MVVRDAICRSGFQPRQAYRGWKPLLRKPADSQFSYSVLGYYFFLLLISIQPAGVYTKRQKEKGKRQKMENSALLPCYFCLRPGFSGRGDQSRLCFSKTLIKLCTHSGHSCVPSPSFIIASASSFENPFL